MTKRPAATSRQRISRMTAAVREFRRFAASSPFSARWLGSGAEAIETGQYDVLDRLSERETWRMGELAEALYVDPSAATRAIGPLEKRGYATRGQDPSDRRCVLVSSTAAGRERHELARSQGLQLWQEALHGEFSDTELEVFAEFMERLTRSFEKVLVEDPN